MNEAVALRQQSAARDAVPPITRLSRIRDVPRWQAIVAALLMVGLLIGISEARMAHAQVDPTSCGHFETQEDAQAAFDSGNLPNPENLDPDGDGIACEDAFAPVDGGPAVIDYTTCGHFETQADAQAALEGGNLPHPEFLDGDGDGIACEDAFDQDTNASTQQPVSTLPSTGTGSSPAATAADVPTVLLGFGVIVAAIALANRRPARLTSR